MRTTNPIESAFATIRLRHRRTKGSGSRRTSLAIMFKQGQSAQGHWRKLKVYKKIETMLESRIFVDGNQRVAA